MSSRTATCSTSSSTSDAGVTGRPTSDQVNFAAVMAAAARDPDLLRAGTALATNDLPVAESLLRPYLKRRPTDVAAIRMMAELAARIGRLVDSENLLRRALELAPSFTAARANLATVLYKQNRPADAIVELEAIEREGSANLGHTSLKAAALGRIGGHDEALALYRTILDQRPDEPKLWMSYGAHIEDRRPARRQHRRVPQRDRGPAEHGRSVVEPRQPQDDPLRRCRRCGDGGCADRLRP